MKNSKKSRTVTIDVSKIDKLRDTLMKSTTTQDGYLRGVERVFSGIYEIIKDESESKEKV